MSVLYFDCFSGISGDMTVAALLDLGIDMELFRSELDKLNLGGYDIIAGKTEKDGIAGTDFKVIIHEDYQELQHAHHKHQNRNLANIEKLIDESDLQQTIKDFSKRVFREIAGAEARVHNKGINEVHFHEIGAIDSIIDIVGTAICLDILGVDRVFSSALHEGCGFIECRHGVLPVPVPAVMEMLKDSKIPLITEDISTELVTPTGMGIIKCLAAGFGKMPAITVNKVGYGFGKKDVGRFNALRVVMGNLAEYDSEGSGKNKIEGTGKDEAEDTGKDSNNDYTGKDINNDYIMEEIILLETNIDNMSPELIGYVMEKLMENGALDAFFTPVYMKKNRPAVMLTVLTDKDNEEKLADIILKETTTLGIRRSITQRYCLERKILKVNTEYGEIRVKAAFKGDTVKIAPEYEDCRNAARSSGETISKIYKAAEEMARRIL